MASPTTYQRYHLEPRPVPDLRPLPPRFRVKVSKLRLLALVLRELLQFRGNLPVALSRPCVYGVFSRPVGGLAPKEERCVGCLRCTVQYPEVVQILPNPERRRLGDPYLTPEHVETLRYEARTGRVPVRGAGYRGPFGGDGWDGMWTDMSEIVRPTRDGIHGRESISTAVDLGAKPSFLRFDARGALVGPAPQVVTLPVPFLFDRPPAAAADHAALLAVLAAAARRVVTLALLPLGAAVRRRLTGPEVAPVVGPVDWAALDRLSAPPRLIELDGWDPERFAALRQRFPASVVAVRAPLDVDVLDLAQRGVRAFHLTADYHGRVGPRFVLELVRAAHDRLVAAGLREEVTLIGSGGIVLAEHVPKAIICGLDAVALDTALWVALEARLAGPCRDPATARLTFGRLPLDWGAQRLVNLVASWRDQLLEVLGAMGLRELRRLRGEIGRCLFQRELEQEAFGELAGYARAA
jgi:hypothetical protein